jgi:ATP adenylyltransferase
MNLKEFLFSKMRMSHIYQPVVIKALLLRQGKASRNELAGEILKYDPSQVEYYEAIIDNMVGRVLRNHQIIEKIKNQYSLREYHSLNSDEIRYIIEVCDNKISDYIKKRGVKIWEHRRKTRNVIPGSIKFQVLKRAKFRCELCGVSAEEKSLEVDHIVPKNLGGEDSINNYQALCFSCNSMKRDQDTEDFRNVYEIYGVRSKGYIFCNQFEDRGYPCQK